MPGQRSQSSYRVIRRIATGGMAEVFLAESAGVAEFEKVVAIKRVLPHLARNPKFVRMFLDEARLAAKLNHRNIVQVFDVGQVGDAYFLVMEYIDGTNLKDMMDHYARAHRRVPVNIAVYIAIEMCNGLDFAHRAKDRTGKRLNVVHRDVSPVNVLLTRAGGVRITDFGLAKAASQAEKTDPGMVKGKYGYLAPETAAGAEADRMADQFALGVVLWEMLAGRRLFLGTTNNETVQLVREANIPSLRAERPDVPAALERTLTRVLARAPEERFESCATLSRTLTEILFEHRLAVSAQDLISVVADVTGADVTGPARRVAPESIPEPPVPDETLQIRSITDRDASPPPPSGASGSMSPSPVSVDPSPTEASPNRPWMPVSSPPPPMESDAKPARRKRRWIAPFLLLLAVTAGGGAAVRDRRGALALWHRASDAFRAARARFAGSAPPQSPASIRSVDVAPAHPAPADPAVIASNLPDANDASAVAPEAGIAEATPDAGPLPDQPPYPSQVALAHDIGTHIPDCVARFGHHHRHARLAVTYEGSTGHATQVTLTDPYFVANPIGACIADAVRAQTAPRFRRAEWSTTYAFMVH
jgi:serine/threonine-protein kinase